MSDDQKRGLRVALHFVAYLAACGAFVAVRGASIFLAVLAVMAIMGTALRLHECVRAVLSDGGGDLWTRLRWTAPLVVGGAVLWWIGRVSETDGWAFFGVALVFLGFGIVTEQLRANRAVVDNATWPLMGAVVAVAVLGAVLLAVTGSGKAVALVVAALLFLPFALGLMSERMRDPATEPAPDLVTLQQAAIGAGFAAIAMTLLVVLDTNTTFVLVIAGGALALLVAIVARSNADIVVVVAMAAVVWTLTARTAPETENVKATEGERVIVALGDSYISGEGAEEFYEGTNTKGAECRRAPTAYPALLMLEDLPHDLPNDLLFLACSGATIDQVAAQVDTLEQRVRDDDLEVELVLLSVGGNDSLFGAIGRICLLPTHCTELGEAWRANLATVEARLGPLYARVAEVADGAPVVVVPYPIPIAPASCGYSALSGKEHDFLNAFTEELDLAVSRAATDAGLLVVDTVPDAFDGRRLCDRGDDGKVIPAGDAAVNFLAANSVLGTLEQSVSPINWFHNSLHPNEQGHELLRATVFEWLGTHDLDEVPDESPLADRTPATFPALDDACDDETGKELESCSWTLARSSLGGFLLLGLPIFALLIGGLYLVALYIVKLWRSLAPPISTGTAGPEE